MRVRVSGLAGLVEAGLSSTPLGSMVRLSSASAARSAWLGLGLGLLLGLRLGLGLELGLGCRWVCR